MFTWCSLIAFLASVSIATISFQQSGWLDRVVQYHKSRFLDDLKTLPRVEIKASIEPAPFGYVDPGTWDLDSVERLLGLLQYSNKAAPVFRYLRRTMSSRRFMSFAESFKAFPSISKNHPNYFYYDIDPEDYEEGRTTDFPEDITEDSIIVVSNPAEARLPAAQISVRLLKEILEARAIAARYMPSSKSTIVWKPMNKTKSTGATGGPGGNATTVAGPVAAASGGNVTGGEGGNSTNSTENQADK